MADKILQIIAFLLLVTMPWWMGLMVNIDRNGISIIQLDEPR